MRYRRIFRMLVNYGHGSAKAAEIILDAKRGDWLSLQWIRCIRDNSRLKVVN